MSINISQRGVGALFLEAVLIPLSIIVDDPIFYTASIVAAAIILSDLAVFIIILRRTRCSCESKLYKRLWVWEKPVFTLVINCSREQVNIDQRVLPKWLKIIGFEKLEQHIKVRAKASFKHSGIYRLSKIIISMKSPLSLFVSRKTVDASIEFKVLPETLYWLIVALGILGFRGGAGGSVFLSETLPVTATLRSHSGVYYETREYVPGDPAKRIDWKATSRVQKLMIRDYREVFGENAGLLYDTRCIGPSTCDAVASALLSFIVTVVRQGIPLSYVYDLAGERRILFRDYKSLLAYFINLVLEKNIVRELDLYEYIKPLTTRELRKYLSRIVKDKVIPEKPVTDIIIGSSMSDSGRAVIVSMVLHSTRKIIDLVDRLIDKGIEPLLIMPPKPWRDAGDLEEAYRLYKSYNLVVERLRGMGVKTMFWHRRIPGRIVKGVE